MAISPHPTQVLIQQFTSGIGLPFQKLLKSEIIEDILQEIGVKYKSRIYNPIVIVWSFLSQVFDTDHSCQNAVSRIIAYLASEGLETPSENTSAYCQARKKLPEKLFKKLLETSAKHNENKVSRTHLWHGRCVKIIDGSSVSMPDTLKNQKAYLQHGSQKKGCGFPLAKIGVLFSYATGSVVGIVIDIFKTHDIKLARKLSDYLDPGDILLGDRAFCSYIDIYSWKNKGIDSVMRLHQGRLQKGKKREKYTVSPPFKKKKKRRKCPHDRLILWEKPKRKPQDISREIFDSLPKDLVLREIHCYICIPGFRTKEIIVVTTLIDAVEYPSSDILDLYDSRWQAEVNLRNIKTTLEMDILSCQTPEMVRKEIYVYLLAYNLLRSIMYDAGDTFDSLPIRLSLQSTRQ
ncbi:MAG: IS4 family transposase, partial [Crocosphaera sp.]